MRIDGTWEANGFIGPLTGHASSDLALSGGNMTGKIYSSATRILQWTTSDADNNADGASWYGLGKFTPSGDHEWISLSNYWGISIRARDNDHVKINGNVVLNAGNYTSYTVTKTGSGASGSWGISVTGSSASCTGNAATATKATQDGSGNVITSTYLPKRETGAIGGVAGNGSYSYCKIMTIKAANAYMNNPITFTCSGRGIPTSVVTIIF